MPHEKFVFAYETGPLSYLVSTRKALQILSTHKIRDPRFQRLLAQWICGLLGLIGAAILGFLLVPSLWAASGLAPCICLLALFVSVGAGDLVLQLALEDERFFEMATRNRTLLIFVDDEDSLPRPNC
jgi:hypothetical protein